jgi:hypothetical protein
MYDISTPVVIGIILTMLILVCLTVYSILSFREVLRRSQQFSFSSLFHDFERKMWVTFGLGLLFSALYLILIIIGWLFMDGKLRLTLFHLLYENPTNFIWWGLVAFAVLSLCIHCARLFIIYLYNIRSKGP